MANFMSMKFWNFAKKLLVEPFEETESVDINDDEFILQALLEAKEDWLAARSYFENVVDPDLIDHAIYTIEAAERKYMYLLKQAKNRGLVFREVIYSLD